MNKRKLTAMLLSVSMVISLAGCGAKDAAQTPAPADQGTASTTETTDTQADTEAAPAEDAAQEVAVGGTVKIMSGPTGGKDEEEMKQFVAALSEATGLDIQLEKPASDYDQILMQKLNGGEKYDLIYIGASQYANLVSQDALMDITAMVEGSEILTNNVDPQEWEDIKIDGKIYAGFNKQEVHRVVGLNNVMLQAAGIDYKAIEPTMDGYYKVFKALKDNNPDPDFYPFNTILSETWDLQPWMASLGLKNGVVLDDSGKKYAPYATDEAAPVWEWFKKLYDEGLLDPSSFVDKTKDMRDKMGAQSLKTAVTADWVAWVGLHNANAQAAGITEEDYQIVSLPGLQTPDGSYMLGKGGASLFGVPANSENPEGAIKVLEYFATQEGGNLLSAGVEGYDYTGTEGSYTQTEIGAQHGNDHGAPFPIFKDYQSLFPYNPGVEEALSYKEYAAIDMPIPNETEYKEIVGKWGIKIVKGEVSAAEGLSGMRAELTDRKVTD